MTDTPRPIAVIAPEVAPRARPSGHAHEKQDEFVCMLEGACTLMTDAGETPLSAGMCAGFPAGTGDAHHPVNRGDADCLDLEVGDGTPFERVTHPDYGLDLRPGPGGTPVF